MGICFVVWRYLLLLLMALMARGNKQTFFPSGDPNFVYVYLKLPVGTDVKHTDSVTQGFGEKGTEGIGKR